MRGKNKVLYELRRIQLSWVFIDRSIDRLRNRKRADRKNIGDKILQVSLDGSFQVFVNSKEVAVILRQKMLDHTKTDLDVRVTGKRI